MKVATKPKALSQQQVMFIDGVMAGKTQTQAYIDAGYKANGAAANAARLIANDKISAELAKRKAAYAKDAGITVSWCLEQMKEHVGAELPDLFNEDGELLHPKQWPKHMRRLVDKVKVVQNRTGTVVIAKSGEIIHVPMYTKEVSLEAKAPILGKLLDWVSDKPAETPAGAVTNNTIVNVDQLLLQIQSHAPLQTE